MKVHMKAPAKINLSLDVLHKRKDGYHEVEMVMTTIDLADHIELTDRVENKITIDTLGSFVPTDHRNLAYKAAMLLKERFGIKRGVHIYIDKHIPVSAGLAGGSSDAAATLKGLNQLWDLNLSIDELSELGAEIGSDVAFCVYGKTALASGRGEKIKLINPPPPCYVLLAKPPIGVSTAEVYSKTNLEKIDHPDVQAMVNALKEQDYPEICCQLGNSLEKVTFSCYPEVEQIKEQMKKLGADGVLMSGSGPTVFGLVKHENRAQRIYNGLRGFCQDVFLVRIRGDY